MKSCYFPGCSNDGKCTCDLCIASMNTILDLMPSRSSKSPSKNLLSFNQSRIPSTPKSKSDYFPGCRKCVSCTCDLCMESMNATIDLMPSSNIQRTPPSINLISFNQSISPSTPKSTANIKSLDTSLLLNSTAIIDFEQNVDKKKKKRWFLNGLVVKRFFLCLGVVLGLAFGVMEFGNISYRARSIPSQKVFGDGVVKGEDLFITSKLCRGCFEGPPLFMMRLEAIERLKIVHNSEGINK